MKTTSVKYMKSATRSDIVGFVYDYLHKLGWKTSFNYYMYRPIKFMNKNLVIPEASISEFNKFVDYCALAAKNFTSRDEAARYQGRHGLSIYFSVVLYWLLTSFGVINEKRLSFCQGYYSFAVPDPPGDAKYRAGIHSWLSCNGSVLDVTLWQQGCPGFVKADGTPLVIKGKIPDNLNLVGFEEDKSLVKEYARQFAKDSGLSFYDWLDHHREQADLLDNVRKLEQE
jgi:hypothetical protein